MSDTLCLPVRSHTHTHTVTHQHERHTLSSCASHTHTHPLSLAHKGVRFPTSASPSLATGIQPAEHMHTHNIDTRTHTLTHTLIPKSITLHSCSSSGGG